AEGEEGPAADRADGADAGEAIAVEDAHDRAGETGGGELVPGDAAGLAASARARPDDEIEAPSADRLDQAGDGRGIVGAVAVHEHQDVGTFGRRGRRQAGPARAPANLDPLGARG